MIFALTIAGAAILGFVAGVFFIYGIIWGVLRMLLGPSKPRPEAQHLPPSH